MSDSESFQHNKGQYAPNLNLQFAAYSNRSPPSVPVWSRPWAPNEAPFPQLIIKKCQCSSFTQLMHVLIASLRNANFALKKVWSLHWDEWLFKDFPQCEKMQPCLKGLVLYVCVEVRKAAPLPPISLWNMSHFFLIFQHETAKKRIFTSLFSQMRVSKIFKIKDDGKSLWFDARYALCSPFNYQKLKKELQSISQIKHYFSQSSASVQQ